MEDLLDGKDDGCPRLKVNSCLSFVFVLSLFQTQPLSVKAYRGESTSEAVCLSSQTESEGHSEEKKTSPAGQRK